MKSDISWCVVALHAWLACVWHPLSVLAAGDSPRQAYPAITTIQQLYSLTPEQSAQIYSIRLRGVVLYCDPRWRLLFFQDETEPMFLSFPENQPEVRPGEIVDVEALSKVDKSGQNLSNLRVRTAGQSPLPAPVHLEINSLLKGVAINRRAAFRGLVERLEQHDSRLRMHVQIDSRHTAEVFVRHFRREHLADLENAVVIVTGVNASYQADESQPRHLKFFVPSLEDVVVLERERGSPFQLPVLSIARVKERMQAPDFDGPDLRRVHVTGRVIEQKVGEWIRVQDDSDSIVVWSDLRTQTRSGDLIEIAGFPRIHSNGEPILRTAVFRVSGTGSSGPALSSDLTPPVLRTVQEVRNLSPEEARRCYPVQLRGTVTYYDREWRVLFIHDESGGIFVDSADQEFLVEAGHEVEVTGVTDPGGYAPMVTRVRLVVRGSGVVPEPKRVSLENLNTGREDSQWVEQEGVVRSVDFQGEHCIMQLKAPSGFFQVTLPVGPPKELAGRLVDSKLRVRGACGVLANIYRQLIGINLHVPNWKHVEFLRMSPQDPFAVSQIPISELLRFTPQDIFEHRVRVPGVVTFVRNDGSIYLQDGNAGTRVHSGLTSDLQAGELVEALGFPVIGGYTPTLDSVQFKRVGRRPLPEPVRTVASALLQGTNDAQRVRLEARLIESVAGPKNVELALEHAGVVFNAILDGPLASVKFEKFRPGSVLALTGICQLQVDEWRNVRSFRLLVPSLADIQLLRAPSWWSLQRVLALGGTMTGVLTLALAWAASLRRRVSKQTRTIRQQLEQELALERKYRDLFENASDVIYTVDLSGRCTSLNRAAEQTFGFRISPDDSVSHARFYTPDSFARLDEALKRLNLGDSVPQLELEALNRDGHSRVVELRARLIELQGEPVGYQCIARDVTERRQLESQLQQARKLESVGQLAAGIAHDFNNILTIVQGNASLLASTNPSSSERVNMAEAILQASERAAGLTHQLVLFSRKRRPQLRVLNLNEVAREMMKMLGRVIGEHIELELSCGHDLPTVRGDRNMIEQVILNLAVNARDAMARGGRLRIATAKVQISPEACKQNHEARPGDAVLLEVSDSGSGIPPEIVPRIFEPFFTTKEVGKGTGLGLATVYGIVKQHGGWIDVTSEIGRGTTFQILLPPCADPQTTESSGPDLRTPDLGTETILLVEDESSVRTLIETLLTQSGYKVLSASDGIEAQQVWREHKGRVDLLLTDVVMPGGISGIELAEILQREASHLKVIFTSGYSPELASGRFQFDGSVSYLAKPYVPQTLLGAIRQCLDQR